MFGTRNEYLIFTEADMALVEDKVNSFADIVKAMGLHVSTALKLTSNKEALEISYVITSGAFPGGGKRMFNVYKKSVVKSWQSTMEEIQSGLFNELKKISAEVLQAAEVTK